MCIVPAALDMWPSLNAQPKCTITTSDFATQKKGLNVFVTSEVNEQTIAFNDCIQSTISRDGGRQGPDL
jgi:hypothetical protein